MKVGILTLKLHSNFGFLMQSYALQTIVRRLGHEPYHFYIKEEPISLWKKAELLVKKAIKNVCFGEHFKLFPYYPTAEDYAFKDKNTWRFIHDNISLTPYIPSLTTEHTNKIPKYDSYIVGSDQVWRREFTDDILCYYFNFVQEDKKRMSYAASFGTDTISYSKRKLNLCKDLLNKFDLVTVREDDGVRICKEYFDHDAIKVIDPTLLLTSDDYEKLIDVNETSLSQEAYVFVYLLRPTEEKTNFVEKFSREKGIKVVNIMPKMLEKVGKGRINECVFPSISTWLKGFKEASYVITDSFHASVFSIIFNKQFFVINDKIGGVTRIPSLLNMLNLNDRYANVYKPDLEEIDYDSINKILLDKRNEAINLIKTFLK